MATINIGTSAMSHLNAGASILAAARTVETRLIKVRLAAFERAQRSYSAAHDKVGAAEAQLGAAQTRLGELDADQDETVDALARALVAEGQPFNNPFGAFGPLAPRKLMAQPVADEVRAIHQLVAAVQRGKGVSKPTLQAAQTAEKAARAVEQQLAQIEKLQESTREARHTRDAVAQGWAKDLAALKRGARAASDDGAQHLYATLFDRPVRPSTKNGKASHAVTPAEPVPTPTASPTSAP
jgi:hypothetical protein